MKHILTLAIVIGSFGMYGCSSYHVHARHILIAPPQHCNNEERAEAQSKAEQLRSEILNGSDFGTVAKQHSMCPSKTYGGDLGTVLIDQYVGPLRHALKDRRIGEVGPVVETVFGYHIVQVIDRGRIRKSTIPLVSVVETIESIQKEGGSRIVIFYLDKKRNVTPYDAQNNLFKDETGELILQARINDFPYSIDLRATGLSGVTGTLTIDKGWLFNHIRIKRPQGSSTLSTMSSILTTSIPLEKVLGELRVFAINM